MSNGWQGVFVNKDQEKKQPKAPIEKESYVSRKLRELREREDRNNIEEVEIC